MLKEQCEGERFLRKQDLPQKTHKKLGTQTCNLFSYIAKNAMPFTDNSVPKWPYWCKIFYWTAFFHLETLQNAII